MNTLLRIGDLVRLATTTEALTLIALDGQEAWLRDDAGNHLCHRVEDLERVHSKAFERATKEQELMASLAVASHWMPFGEVPK